MSFCYYKTECDYDNLWKLIHIKLSIFAQTECFFIFEDRGMEKNYFLTNFSTDVKHEAFLGAQFPSSNIDVIDSLRSSLTHGTFS